VRRAVFFINIAGRLGIEPRLRAGELGYDPRVFCFKGRRVTNYTTPQLRSNTMNQAAYRTVHGRPLLHFNAYETMIQVMDICAIRAWISS
jgi:hypothetical protein